MGPDFLAGEYLWKTYQGRGEVGSSKPKSATINPPEKTVSPPGTPYLIIAPMHWIALSAKDADNATLEKRVWDTGSNGAIEILIATDCIREGQNLQDCDDLRYRDKQLLRLKDEVLDIEDLGDIVEFEQGGKARAIYGKGLLDRLSRDLSNRHGKGFSRSNLSRFRQFYLAYQNCAKASHNSSWSHYSELLKLEDPLERSFYEQQAVREKRSVPHLQRQKKSSLFLRPAAGKDKDSILQLASQGQIVSEPADLLRDPYAFEFLTIPTRTHPANCRRRRPRRTTMKSAPANFQTLPLQSATRQLLAKLGYKSDKFLVGAGSKPQDFLADFASGHPFDHAKALVPDWKTADRLFFVSRETADLSTAHGDPKRMAERVTGLITILKRL